MGTKVQVDGVGVVEFDDGFKALSPADQQSAVDEVANTHAATAVAPAATAPAAQLLPTSVPRTGYRAQVNAAFDNATAVPAQDQEHADLGLGQSYYDTATQPLIGTAGSVAGIPGNLGALAGAGISKVGAQFGSPDLGQPISDAAAPFTTQSIENSVFGPPESGQQQGLRSAGELFGPSAALKAGSTALPYLAGASTLRNFAKETRAAGLVIPPGYASNNPSFASTVASAIGGKTKMLQDASAINQPRVNDLIAADLGLPKGTDLTESAINQVHTEANKAYDAVSNAVPPGTRLKLDTPYKDAIDALGTSGPGSTGRISPPASNPEIAKLKSDLLNDHDPLGNVIGPKVGFHPSQAITEVRALRQDAKAIFKSQATQTPDQLALASAKAQAADAIENFVERRLTQLGKPDVVKDYQRARTLSAKAYDADSAADAGGDINAARLTALWNQGRPLTGNMLTVAKAASVFPKAFQKISTFGGLERLSVLDAAAAAATTMAFHNPASAAVVLARPALRSTLLSSPYQDAMFGTTPRLGLRAFRGPAATSALGLVAPQDQTTGN